MKQEGNFNWDKEWRGIYFVIALFSGLPMSLWAIFVRDPVMGEIGLFCTAPAIFAFGLIGFITRLHFHRWHTSSITALALAIWLLSIGIIGMVFPNNYQKSCQQRLVPYADLSHCDFSGKDLSGMNLRGAIIDNSKLNGANLNGAALLEASIRNADLSNADLTQANLTGANLNGTKLQNAIFTDAILNNAHLTNTDITSAIGFTGEMLTQLASYDGLISEKPDERFQILENVCNGQGYEKAISYIPSKTYHLLLIGIDLNQRNQEKLAVLSDKFGNYPIVLTALAGCMYE
ncbi:pentapeptide repeat-containing protein, partial [Candidatus Bathyarchaeota archaeon A05DMB-2]|nr:pentapeptide repeat-containing protein [Candidatus Bathyarchaeota archaeon A05DMB-2]